MMPEKKDKKPRRLLPNALLWIGLLNFLCSLPGLGLLFMDISSFLPGFILTGGLAVLFLVLFRRRLHPRLGLCLGWYMVLITGAGTLCLLISGGSLNMAPVFWLPALLLPFAPLLLYLLAIPVWQLVLYELLILLAELLTVLLLKKQWRPRPSGLAAALLCVLLTLGNVLMYRSSAEFRYQGHGFDYMNGFSSTDFSDYYVYSSPSKLVSPDGPVSLQLTDPAEMPVMDGAEACYPLYAAVAKAVYKDIGLIEKAVPETEKQVNGQIVTFTNSVVGFNRLLQGEADLFFGARPSDEQLEQAAETGVELELTEIGREGFVFFVEEDNPVTELTAEQIRRIYSGETENWLELGGKDQKIVAFQRSVNSGSQTMMLRFMGDTPLMEPKRYETVSAMGDVIRVVAQYADEAGAMGYTFRYFLEGLQQEEGVRMLRIDGAEPTQENIGNGSYPLTVGLYLVTRKDDPNPNVRKMIDFMLSPEGQEIIEKTGYAPLP